MATGILFFYAGLTQNLSQIYDCERKVVNYTCVVNSTLVQWIAEPFISATGDPLFISSTSVNIPAIENDDGNVIIQLERFDGSPFTTRMQVISNLSDTFNVVCVDVDNNSSTSREHSSSMLLLALILTPVKFSPPGFSSVHCVSRVENPDMILERV